MHQGNLIKESIENSGITITFICNHVGISRTTLYRYFEIKTLPENKFNKIYELIDQKQNPNLRLELEHAKKIIKEQKLKIMNLQRKLANVQRQV